MLVNILLYMRPVICTMCIANLWFCPLKLIPSTSNLDPCEQPIYPPGFISNMTHCNVLVPQWTYNKTTGQCVNFYYYACGEDRQGYNVFASEQECTKTCVHKGNV